MPPIEIRPFQRSDREQLTALVNLHVESVVPGGAVSVNALMSQLEREPGEPLVDPWVVERLTLVAIEKHAVVAGAHLLRYGGGDEVGPWYRDAAEIRWLVCSPAADAAGAALVAASCRAMADWGATTEHADGALPAPFVYGIPACWPHVRALLQRAGFVHEGHVEIVLVARVDELPNVGPPPLPHLELRRTLGSWPRLSAVLGDDVVGYIEVQTDHTSGGTLSRFAGWADVCNLQVAEEHRRRGVGTWLLGHAADWLRLAGAARLVAYAWPEQADELAFYAATGFRELVRTERDWRRRP